MNWINGQLFPEELEDPLLDTRNAVICQKCFLVKPLSGICCEDE